jgi:hypothetical protein
MDGQAIRRVGAAAAVLGLLVAACGEVGAQQGARTPAAPVATAAPAAMFPGVVALQGAEGVALRGEMLSDARLTDDGTVAVAARSAGGRTEVRWLAAANGAAIATVSVPGALEIAAIDVPGDVVALVTEAGVAEPDAIAPSRERTEVVVVNREGEQFRRSYDGNVVPEGFANWFAEGSDVPGAAFALEYSPAVRPTHYRVRTIDLATGDLGLPLSLRDKTQTVDQLMAGVSRTQLLAARDGLLFTLYRGHHDEGHGSYAFVHTLGFGNGVWCLVVPDEMELADLSGALALDPAGRRLVALSANGTIAAIELGAVTDGNRSPHFDVPADLGTTADGTPSIATGATSLWIGLGRTLLQVDPRTFVVVASAEVPLAIEAIAESADGIVVAGEGRMIALSTDLTVTAEGALPAGVGPLHRIVAG